MTSRRGFLGALLAGATLDPERLLWRPGAKLISIPKRIEPATGISIRLVTGYDIVNDRFYSRLDVLHGIALPKSVRGEACFSAAGLSEEAAMKTLDCLPPEAVLLADRARLAIAKRQNGFWRAAKDHPPRSAAGLWWDAE